MVINTLYLKYKGIKYIIQVRNVKKKIGRKYEGRKVCYWLSLLIYLVKSNGRVVILTFCSQVCPFVPFVSGRSLFLNDLVLGGMVTC